MAIPHMTVLQLSQEVIVSVSRLIDFDKESIRQIVESLRRPGVEIQDPTPGAEVGSAIPTPPFFSGLSRKRVFNLLVTLFAFMTLLADH